MEDKKALRQRITQDCIQQIKDHLHPPAKTNEEIIKTFLSKMSAQDNRCTAAPYFYVIRTEVEVEIDIRNADETKVYYDCETYDSMEELLDMYVEDGASEDEIRKVEMEAYEFGVRKEWVHKGMFLTEEEAKEHLRLNHYHYSANAHTYIDHAWRAPDMARFFKALFEEYGVDMGNWKV